MDGHGKYRVASTGANLRCVRVSTARVRGADAAVNLGVVAGGLFRVQRRLHASRVQYQTEAITLYPVAFYGTILGSSR